LTRSTRVEPNLSSSGVEISACGAVEIFVEVWEGDQISPKWSWFTNHDMGVMYCVSNLATAT